MCAAFARRLGRQAGWDAIPWHVLNMHLRCNVLRESWGKRSVVGAGSSLCAGWTHFLSTSQAPKPSPGPHKQRECLPLLLVLRNRLK